MGYMGLKHFQESDLASDSAYMMVGVMVKQLEKELKEKGNEFNTAGPENVAMIFEALIIPLTKEYHYYDDLIQLADKTKKLLEDKVNKDKKSDWDSASNRNMHINAYKRMIKSLEKFIESGV
jgi:hypothetical protein